MPHLVLAFPGATEIREDGAALLADKTVAGVAEYRKHWAGDITIAVERIPPLDAVRAGVRWCTPADLGVGIVGAANLADTITGLSPDITLGSLEYHQRGLRHVSGKVVYASEFPIRERIVGALSTNPPLAHRPRIVAGALRQGLVTRDMVRRADGLQCNGWPAWNGFHRLSPDPILYFDTRLTTELIDAHARPHSRLAPDGVLRIGFSGRVIEAKGPRYAVELANRLNRRGVPTTLTIFGEGAQRAELEALDEGHVTWAGGVRFDTDWVRRIPAEIDLMVLPHTQGDPSGTYLEASGLGVPVLGFANSAWSALASRERMGWAVRMRSVEALEERVVALLDAPADVAEASRRGIAFMREHDFETEFGRRIEHLQRVVQS